MRKLTATALALILASVGATAAHADFTTEANALCRRIIDARHFETFVAARKISAALLASGPTGGEPSSITQRHEAAAILTAVHENLASARDSLANLASADSTVTTDMAVVLQQVDYRLHALSARIEALRSRRDFSLPSEHEIAASEPDTEKLMEAWKQLGFANRDCQHVFTSEGNPTGFGEFIAAVAPVCNAIVDRRNANSFDEWRIIAFDAFVAVVRGKPIDPAAISALENMATDWDTAVLALASVSASGAADPQIWQEALATLRERGEILEARAKALRSGNQKDIESAFAAEPVSRILTPSPFGKQVAKSSARTCEGRKRSTHRDTMSDQDSTSSKSGHRNEPGNISMMKGHRYRPFLKQARIERFMSAVRRL